jgi:hypothetical protein
MNKREVRITPLAKATDGAAKITLPYGLASSVMMRLRRSGKRPDSVTGGLSEKSRDCVICTIHVVSRVSKFYGDK